MASETVSERLSRALIKDEFPLFTEAVTEKLYKGAIEYGDESFSKDPLELIGELQQECVDLAGWGWILYRRLERMKFALISMGHEPE